MYCCKQRSSELTVHQSAEQSMKRSVYITTLPITHYCHWRKTNIFIVTRNRNTGLRNPQFIILLCSLWSHPFRSQRYPLTAIAVNGKGLLLSSCTLSEATSSGIWSLNARLELRTHRTAQNNAWYLKHITHVTLACISTNTGVTLCHKTLQTSHTFLLRTYNEPRVYYSLWFQASAAVWKRSSVFWDLT